MPIDFAQIAATYKAPIGMQMFFITETFQRLGKWLRRVERVEQLEKATHDIPVIHFSGDALTLWLHDGQKGALSSGTAQPSFLAVLSGAGAAFAQGIARIGQAAQEDLLLPTTLTTLVDAAVAILASIERFAEPRPEIFDPRKRTAGDLFGELTLFLLAFEQSRQQVDQFVLNFQLASKMLKEAGSRKQQESTTPGAAVASVATRSDQPVGGESIGQLLEQATRYLVGAILLLPLILNILDRLLRVVGLSVKMQILDALEGLQQRLNAFRRDMVDFFYKTLMDFVGEAASLGRAIGIIALLNLKYYTDFAITYLDQLLKSIAEIASLLSQVFGFLLGIVESLRVALESFLNFDFMPSLLNIVGLPALAPFAPSFTVNDLIDAVTGAALIVTRTVLDGALWVLEHNSLVESDPKLARRVKGLRLLLHTLLTPAPVLPPEAAPPDLSKLSFPDLYRAFFVPGAPDPRKILRNLENGLEVGAHDLLGASRDTLLDLGQVLSQAALDASRLGSAQRYQGVLTQAEQTSTALFGPQLEDLRQHIAPPDPVAQAFETWVTRGGFHLIGAVIPRYIGEMRRFWEEEAQKQGTAEKRERPTSPHILAKREKLSTVRVPRMLVRAQGRDLDNLLVAEIATYFQGAVINAYNTGKENLAGKKG